MPTLAEIKELLDEKNCQWEWKPLGNAYNGVPGYLVTSKVKGYEGNSIFLPASGYRYKSSVNDGGYEGYFWSSSRYSGGNGNACELLFDYNKVNSGSDRRFLGRPVRPVL